MTHLDNDTPSIDLDYHSEHRPERSWTFRKLAVLGLLCLTSWAFVLLAFIAFASLIHIHH